MAEDDTANRGGRPSHADKISQLEAELESLTDAFQIMSDRLLTLEQEAPSRQPTRAELDDLAPETVQPQYCECGSLIGLGHFENCPHFDPNPEAVPAETAA